MDEHGTVPQRVQRVALRTVRVEVVEGADKGAHVEGGESITVGSAESNTLVLHDATVSRFHLELTARGDGVLLQDHGSTNGSFVGSTRVERGVLAPGTTVRVGRSALRVSEGAAGAAELHPSDGLGGLRGRSDVMRRLMAQVERAARSDASVLLIGESGTGKELVARALHERSPRAARPFEVVDCASLAPALVASELFGHEKGAFTGADRQHTGAFERAQGGTVFLDELGELPPALQSALLGVLQRRRLRRVGGKTDLAVDVRVVAATHRDLRSEVNAGTFRLDLYYRLAVVVLAIPPLRERREDIPLLVEHFLGECGHPGPVGELLSDATLAQLAAHYWPGNVRELRNVIEATVAMGEAPALAAPQSTAAQSTAPQSTTPHSTAPHPGTPPGSPATPAWTDRTYGDARAAVLREFEVGYIRALLERTRGNVSAASREARLDRTHLMDLIRRHGLK